jgi:hypothetical protein
LNGLASNRFVEHAAKRQTINDSSLNAKPDDTACSAIHDD